MDERETRELIEDMAAVMKSLVSASVHPLLSQIEGLNARLLGIEPSLSARLESITADIVQLRSVEASVRDLDSRITARLAEVKDGAPGQDGRDGKDADPELVRRMAAEAIAEIGLPKDGAPGKSVTIEELEPLVAAHVMKAVAALPPIEPKSVDPMLVKRMVDAAVAALPPAPPGEPGKSVSEEDVRPMLEEMVAAIKGEISGAIPSAVAEAISRAHNDNCIADADFEQKVAELLGAE